MKWIFVGCLLPDLLDKTLYYSGRMVLGLDSPVMQVLQGTRGLGHTAMGVVAISLVAVELRSKILAAVTLGMASHLILDGISDRVAAWVRPISAVPIEQWFQVVLWPSFGLGFPRFPHGELSGHFMSVFSRPEIWVFEGLGTLFLAWGFWKVRQRRSVQLIRESRERT